MGKTKESAENSCSVVLAILNVEDAQPVRLPPPSLLPATQRGNPPAERYIISHQGAPANCCFPPQLAFKEECWVEEGWGWGWGGLGGAETHSICQRQLQRVGSEGVDGEWKRDWMSSTCTHQCSFNTCLFPPEDQQAGPHFPPSCGGETTLHYCLLTML